MRVKQFINRTMWVILLASIMFTIVGCSSGGGAPPATTRAPYVSGPQSFNIGTGSGNYTINGVNVGDRIEFNFTVAGADVTFSVLDPNGNTILNGNGGNKASSGSGSFIASSAGGYNLHFISSGILTSSVLTINYTDYFAQ
jgi:hypothetical protein